MAYGEMTVGELRLLIEGMPNDCPVLIRPQDQEDFSSHDRIRRRKFNSVEHEVIEAKPAKTWNSNTRMLANAYQCVDDRFDQNQILLLEIGENGP